MNLEFRFYLFLSGKIIFLLDNLLVVLPVSAGSALKLLRFVHKIQSAAQIPGTIRERKKDRRRVRVDSFG